MSMYFDLLKTWCDALIRLQIKDITGSGIHGGIMCPVCSRIHGRSADAVYPLMYMAKATGDERYLKAAVDLQAWSDHVTARDGAWMNDPTGHEWKGITAFGALALGEALRHHGSLLDTSTKQRWETRLRSAFDFIERTFDAHYGNVNYPITGAAALALGYEIFGDERYGTKAKSLMKECLAYFTPNDRLIFGEGKPFEKLSPNGHLPVDIGYNVEESLGAFALYGLIMKDKNILDIAEASMRSHLEFMLPDGAWDNSFGTRNYKWSYWGSRTSDGCQIAYGLLADRNDTFAKAVEMNTRLLAACTHEGLLHGGPHYHRHGTLPCVHHTFCHAKALATVLDNGFDKHRTTTVAKLPRDERYGIRSFNDLNVHLTAAGPWRATVSGYDWIYFPEANASGGSLTLLWHETFGPVITASLTKYNPNAEPSNMQPHTDAVDMALTPMIECEINDMWYRSVNDVNAKISVTKSGTDIAITAEGTLVDRNLAAPKNAEIRYGFVYRFSEQGVSISAHAAPGKNIHFVLPIISPANENIDAGADRIVIEKPAGSLIVTAAGAPFAPVTGKRIFNLVPGFEALPLTVALPENGSAVTVTITDKK
ncbi:MAG: hypothetical protein HZC28_07790 [Spirochaetes bacterium]|nr:hypothetical protein [Spirochaetota bacterium]